MEEPELFSPTSGGGSLPFSSFDWVTGFRDNVTSAIYGEEEDFDEADFELQPHGFVATETHQDTD